MKPFRRNSGGRQQRGGFSLVETSFSIGLMSFGLLSLAPLLAFGLQSARLARDDRATAQIARTLVEEAGQGSLGLTPGVAVTIPLDEQGAALKSSTGAAYLATCTPQSVDQGALMRLQVQVTPEGAPGHTRIYAALFPTPSTPGP